MYFTFYVYLHLQVSDMLRHEGGMPRLDTSLSLGDLLPDKLGQGRVAEVLARYVCVHLDLVQFILPGSTV